MHLFYKVRWAFNNMYIAVTTTAIKTLGILISFRKLPMPFDRQPTNNSVPREPLICLCHYRLVLPLRISYQRNYTVWSLWAWFLPLSMFWDLYKLLKAPVVFVFYCCAIYYVWLDNNLFIPSPVVGSCSYD